jgi:hypothetical protein
MKTACVIGGGISGLATCYLLQQQGWAVTLVEASARLGGNAHTMQVVQDWNTDGTPKTLRWVDMGVNDFNENTYTHIVGMLKQLGVPYRPLVDQASFTAPGGTFPPSSKDFKGLPPGSQQALDYVNYTLDPDNQNPPPPDLQTAWDQFQQIAPKDALDPAYANFSIKQYLQDAQAKGKLKNVDLLGKYCLFPRINGMYFTVDDKPEDMPFVGVMQYYVLQEGMGQPKKPGSADNFRQYWANGTVSWITALVNALQNPTSGSGGPTLQPVNVVLNSRAMVQGAAVGQPAVQIVSKANPTAPAHAYDAVILACHATQALRSIRSGITQDQVNVLSCFSYKQSCTIAHTYTPALPVSKSLWRTYNIFIHEGYSDLKPYVINYVVNLHQNDPANPQYDHFNTPYVLYSINPQAAIPQEFVLRQPVQDPATGEYLPAIAYFPHNVMKVGSMWAQSVLWGTHWPYPNDPSFEYHWGTNYKPGKPVQGQNGLYFTGGWTLLAGLHEQCWQSAIEVVNLVVNGPAHADHYTHIPDLRRGAKRFMPDQHRRVLGL